MNRLFSMLWKAVVIIPKVINNNIDPGAPSLKVATKDSHLTFFMNVMQLPGPDLP